jgi:exo-beta-1,3-glucanase (GH17 family)
MTDVLSALRTSRAWINYCPAAPFDFQIGKNPATQEQLSAELKMLYERGFRGLVTNSMTYGTEGTARIAKDLGFTHVIAKLWWADDDTLAVEKSNLARQIEHIDAIVVGNETVHKAVMRGWPAHAAADRLHAEMRAMQEYGKPVTTGLHRDDWARFPEIATDFGDFVFANLQPWWVQLRNDPVLAAQWVAAALQVIADTPGMPTNRLVMAQEAAFPSGSIDPAAAPGATPQAQAVFFQTLIDSGIRFVYGFAFDAWFARRSSPPGGYGGIWDDTRQPKPAVDVLDLGRYER